VRDFGSLNGTYVNSKRLSATKEASQPHVLRKGDNVDCGSQTFKVVFFEVGAALPASARYDKERYDKRARPRPVSTLSRNPSALTTSTQRAVQELDDARASASWWCPYLCLCLCF
jgi:pSer/pThr/pTyr-binding forkhead associated (FHA) protein